MSAPTPYEERDTQIAKAIRSEIEKVQANKKRLGYDHRSAGAAHLDGEISGLRKALALIDPMPWR